MLAIDQQLLEIDEAIDDVAQTFFTLDSGAFILVLAIYFAKKRIIHF